MSLAAITQSYTASSDIDWTPYFIIWGFCAFLGMAIGSGKGKGAAGFMFGLLLGPLGLILIAIISSGSTPEKSKISQIQVRPVEAGWFQDPLGRFDGRYYDGTQWTQHVGRIGADGSRANLEDPI